MKQDVCVGSPGADGVTVAGQRLAGGRRVHVASVGPSGRGGFRGVVLLHGRHGGPRAGALGPAGSPLLLIGTETHGHTLMNTCRRAHVTAVRVNTTNRANGISGGQ